MQSNFIRLIKNKRSIIFIYILLLFILCDMGIHLLADKLLFDELGQKYAPAFASFLSATTIGHIPQKLVKWFLPIYILLICSDNYITDVKTGYNNIMIGKMGKANYIKNKLLESFVFPTVMMFVILLINFILCLIIFQGGDFWQGRDDYVAVEWVRISLAHPNVTYFIFMICSSFLAGLCGLFCTSCAFVFPDYKMVYPLTFVVWFYGVSATYSTAYLMQPFAEFGFDFLIPIWIVTISLTVITTLCAYWYKVKTDEL